MPQFYRNHLVLTNRTRTLPYTSVVTGRSKIIPRPGVNRTTHGDQIRNQFNIAVDAFQQGMDEDFVYLVFQSPPDFLLDLDKLDKSDCRLANSREYVITDEQGQHHTVIEATVYLNQRAIAKFLNKVQSYMEGDLVRGQPRHRMLMSNIESIRSATLQSFWKEPEMPFPASGNSVWWEIWLHKESGESTEDVIHAISPRVTDAGVQIGQRLLTFPEHVICLMRSTPEQLASSILYTDRLAEIRFPKETADFFMYQDHAAQQEWINNLLARVDNLQHEHRVSVCLLDTGVTKVNPLLSNLIPDRNLDTINPVWTTADTSTTGHGTSMAGLIFYGDLTEAFVSNGRITINHHLESIKLIQSSHVHDPEMYGAVTQEAIGRAEIINREFKRIVCMAVSRAEMEHKGRPSSWSSAIDQTCFGNVEEPNVNMLFFVASGNVDFNDRINYPLVNSDSSVHDPAQSHNAITVGSYTLKDSIDLRQNPGAELLAVRGAMSPCNPTSLSWIREWCHKPDIVMEGANQAEQFNSVIDPDSLHLLTAAKGGTGRSWLTIFGDTSASTALASKFAAELCVHYPNFWPESIRALVIHSADWTPAMLQNRNIDELSGEERERLISSVGYGVPNLQKAQYSANNSLSFIAERTIRPFRIDQSSVKSDSFHLFELPWPTEVLEELYATTVSFKITLSYFIEPNPGEKLYDLASSYRSHGLRFKMIDSGERDDAFLARISRTMREDDYIAEGSERWILGGKLRDKGTIHKDIWQGSAIDLSRRNKIAVYPVGGWWKTRKKHMRYLHDVRYSLIMTIETPDIDVDIFTPIENIIQIEI